jgi:hypothetical protein
VPNLFLRIIEMFRILCVVFFVYTLLEYYILNSKYPTPLMCTRTPIYVVNKQDDA